MLLKKKKKTRNSAANILHDRRAILHEDSPFSVREAYKTLRTNLTFSMTAKGSKLIGITSAVVSEGKSTNCLNLAITIAENGARVIILDCDMRRPNVARLIDCSATPGLSNVLVGVGDLDKAIQKNAYGGVDVLPAGDLPPNPTELLDSDRMQEILSALRDRYDYILLDMPPVNVVADALILSKSLTGIVFIVRQGHSERGEVSGAIKQLEFAGVKVLGFVLNGVPARQGRYGKYGKYGKYSKYSYRYQYSSYGED